MYVRLTMGGKLSEQQSASPAADADGPGGPALLREIRRLRLEREVISAELRAERSRSKSAAESERNRIERNLHDGAQQRLLTVALAMRAAESALLRDPADAGRFIASATGELMSAIIDLRDLAAGMQPAALAEGGLAGAVAELAQRAAVPVDVAEFPPCELSQELEAAVYFVIAEALSNVTKHAQATRATITITASDSIFVAEIRDDGIGGASTRAHRGTGLCGLAERVGAFDGRFDVLEVVGGGTLICAAFPLNPASEPGRESPAVSPTADAQR